MSKLVVVHEIDSDDPQLDLVNVLAAVREAGTDGLPRERIRQHLSERHGARLVAVMSADDGKLMLRNQLAHLVERGSEVLDGESFAPPPESVH